MVKQKTGKTMLITDTSAISKKQKSKISKNLKKKVKDSSASDTILALLILSTFGNIIINHQKDLTAFN